MRIESFDPGSARACQLAVAGPAALLVAKLIKLGERLADGSPARIQPKDALDILRILRGVDAKILVAGLQQHRSNTHAEAVSAAAMEHLAAHGRSPTSPLAQLAAAAVGGDPVFGASFAALADRLLAAVDS